MERNRPGENVVTKGRFIYVREVSKGPGETIDFHHISARRNDTSLPVVAVYGLLLSFSCSSFLILLKTNVNAVLICIFAVVGFLFTRLRRQVLKESIIIFPSLGVQLETAYRSGRTLHRFVPIGKILKPVLNECVTPVTCYWSLSLIVRGEEELLPVFKNLYPSLTMLVPIWEALLTSIVNEKCMNLKLDSDTANIPAQATQPDQLNTSSF